MKVVLQRVREASVSVDGDRVSAIGPGLLLLVGISSSDTEGEVDAAIAKISSLRMFPDDSGLMNRSLLETGGEILVVSQFTLLGDVGRGRRPSFSAAAPPETAAPLIQAMVEGFRARGIITSEGRFGAHMEVSLLNDGPVTLVIDFRAGKAFSSHL